MTAPLFSVVIPVFNRQKQLRESLLSVLTQTCRDFEVIVVDDGSVDNPKAIVDQFTDSRIKFIRQDNKGGSAARNTAIAAAKGRFIAFLDSDDEWLPFHLESARTAIGSQLDLVVYSPVVMNRGHGVGSLIKPKRGIGCDENMATYLMCSRGFVPTSTIVVPAEAAKRVRYDPRLPFAQDTDFAVRLYIFGLRFRMLPTPAAIVSDQYSGSRTSFFRRPEPLESWLEELSPFIPRKAYYGYRGWHIAKCVRQENIVRALWLYTQAILHRSFAISLAGVILAQIVFSGSTYRCLSDKYITFVFSGISRFARRWRR